MYIFLTREEADEAWTSVEEYLQAFLHGEDILSYEQVLARMMEILEEYTFEPHYWGGKP